MRARLVLAILASVGMVGLAPAGARAPVLATTSAAPVAATGVHGAVDTASETAGTFVVHGWFWDPTGATLVVVAEIDGAYAGAAHAPFAPRPDVASAVPGAPLETGFSIWLDETGPRTGTTCVHGRDAFGNRTRSIGCGPVPPPTFAGSPSGALDEVRAEVGRFVVRGWAADPDADTDPAPVEPGETHVYMDGQYLAPVPLGVPRADVAAAVPGAGHSAGYEATLPARSGRHQICVYAINRGRTGRNVALGCRTITVPATSGAPAALGELDGSYLGPQFGGTGNAAIGVRGWSALPDGSPVDIRVVAVGGFLGNAEQRLDVTGTTGALRPDVPAVFPALPANTGYEMLVGGGHFFEYRLACVIARSPTAETLLGCTSYERLDGRSF